jgi:hypothetical protein
MVFNENDNKPSQSVRRSAPDDMARLINDHLLKGFGDEDGYPIEIQGRELKRFVKEHWVRLSHYAHLIHEGD